MQCPKCSEPMRSYERNNVTIDHCTGCRGIFLDRGELERLIDAESAHYAQQPVAPQGRPAPQAPSPWPGEPSPQYQPGRGDYQRRDDDHRGRDYSRGDHRPKRRRSFLDDLFD